MKENIPGYHWILSDSVRQRKLVALVTGAAQRVGKSIAVELAVAGCDLALHYRSSADEAEELAKLLRAKGRRIELFQADLSIDGQAGKLAHSARKKFGQLDIVVNNAATYFSDSVEELAKGFSKAWERSINPNLRGPVVLSMEAGLLMQKQASGGHIVNILDWAPSAGRVYKSYLPYLVSKAGLEMATRTLALELAPKVRVNGVANGNVIPPEGMKTREIKAISARTPLQRWGTGKSTAEAVLALLNTSFVTGTVLLNDGGRSITY